MATYTSSDNSWASIPSALGGDSLYLVAPYDSAGSGAAKELRVRSRERHDPGDGNYFCSHIQVKMSGWRVGGTFYLLSLEPTVGVQHHLSYDTYYRLQWDGETYVWEYKYFRYGGTNYHISIGSLTNPRKGNAFFTLREGSSWYSGDHDFDFMRTLVSSWSAGSVKWGRTFQFGYDPTLAGPRYEERYMRDQIDGGFIPNIGLYLEEAYISACNSLPHIATNNIANVGQVFSTLASLRAGYRSIPDMLDALKDTWLGYRYEYLTTKSDIEEITSCVDRLRAIGSVDLITGRGSHTFEGRNGDLYRIRCSVQLPPTAYQDVQSWAERFGVALDGYNMWDMIPYSFIIDWFLPIGPMLEKARDADYAARLTPSVVWYSITHEFTNSFGCHQVDYYRWQGDVHAPATLPITIIPELSKSGRTWIKRGTDLFALFS